jgi:hypothetical protein
LTENLVIDEPGSLLTPEISGSNSPTNIKALLPLQDAKINRN